METKRNIPDPIKRRVRRRCGFGCVICGNPLYDYDHIIDFAIVKEHTEENITLLCSDHHTEKKKKLLTVGQIREADRDPFNIKNEQNPYRFNFEGSTFNLKMGECDLVVNNINSKKDIIAPFVINNKKLISFEIIDGKLFFNLFLYDKEGKLLLKILENEMIYNVNQWDIEFVGNRLKLREGSRKIIFDINFIIPNTIHINKGIFNYDGYEIRIEKGAIKQMSNNIQLFSKKIINFRVIFALGRYNLKFPVVAYNP